MTGELRVTGEFTFTSDFKPGDPVLIVPLAREAVVEMVRIGLGGLVDYFVTWWEEGKRMEEWLRRDEIQPPRKKQ